MSEYYFLASLLPPLEIGHVPSLGFSELKELLEVNLSPEDKARVHTFLHLIDYENLKSFWSGEPLDPRGNYVSEELEQALFDGSWPGDEEFPPYLRDFLAKYHSNEERAAHFAELMSQFLKVEEEVVEGFLRDYFAFERQWRLVMVGFRAKKLGRNLDRELQYEDAKEPIVAQILAQKDAKAYEPPFEFHELKPLFEAHAESPLELNKALLEWRFGRYIEFVADKIFSIDRILGYMARLILVERWLELDVQKGIEMIDKIEEGVR